MQLTDVADLLAGFDGVRATGGDGEPAQWRYHGRMVARQLDATHIVIRSAFDHREGVLARHPGTFSVPTRFRKHMMVVADLEAGDERAIADALAAAWQLQCSPD
ncbi:hypothetical protein [Microbacterium elymi]|uniref:MmcQ/YjbR family DNA-binding protein n=1 Tax=Microbacterium elymi TaxID=2909587 RepID=A0ABY5NHA0_9MICO|nr:MULTISPECIES: hypothetical protein [Microbacterium]UUT34533.1 hypothetical protein L2X98_28780 [Microbacterium elymi]